MENKQQERWRTNVVSPDPIIGNVVRIGEETFGQHEHAENTGTQRHSDDVMRDKRRNQQHKRLGDDQTQEEIRQKQTKSTLTCR